MNPWFGPGMGFGFGRRRGRGFGRGACWWLLDRGMFGAYGYPGVSGYRGYDFRGRFNYPYPQYLGAITNEQERQMLEQQASDIELQIADVKRRLKELSSSRQTQRP